MPIFFQHDIDGDTRLAVWKIEEEEAFFSEMVPLQRSITHPHKRRQHLAGRFLLYYLFPQFPLSLIQIADTRKPFLRDEAYHFSISHCGDYAAAIASRSRRVGIDIELPSEKLGRIREKFLHPSEADAMNRGQASMEEMSKLTLFWSAKEAVFKWWGHGGVDFSEMIRIAWGKADGLLQGSFQKGDARFSFPVHYRMMDEAALAWIVYP